MASSTYVESIPYSDFWPYTETLASATVAPAAMPLSEKQSNFLQCYAGLILTINQFPIQ